jgi:hypothetical protein
MLFPSLAWGGPSIAVGGARADRVIDVCVLLPPLSFV